MNGGESYSHSVVWMYEKNTAISFVITFLRWLIKPFIVLMVILAFWTIRLLVKKRVKSWRKVLTIILLGVALLLLVAILLGQIFGARFGIDLFEYSLI